MQSYKIEVAVTHAIVDLQRELQAAYDEGAAGRFSLIRQDGGVKIVFWREYSDDAEYIERRMANGLTFQKAACDQLAAELEELGSENLAPVVAALRFDAVAFDDKGLPFSEENTSCAA